MKRIIHLISGLEIGGTETQLLRVLPYLQKYHKNYVCCVRGSGPIGVELKKKGVEVRYLNFRGFDLLAIYRFWLIVKEIKPDILVTYLIHADLYGRFFGRLFGIKKIVCSKRGVLLQWEWLSHFDRISKFMVDHYLVQTKTAKDEWMDKLSLSPNKFTIIPNAIDIDLFDKKGVGVKKKDLGMSEKSIVVVCVARLRRGKGHEILIRAFKKLYLKHKNIELVLVGDGEREDELKKMVGLCALEKKVHFFGNRSDVIEILRISDIFVLPTEGEGMSNAIIEAMVSGLPVLTTNIPDNRDLIIDDETGLLANVGDVKSFYRKMLQLVEDSKMRKRLGDGARKDAIKKYSKDNIVSIFADFYNKV